MKHIIFIVGFFFCSLSAFANDTIIIMVEKGEHIYKVQTVYKTRYHGDGPVSYKRYRPGVYYYPNYYRSYDYREEPLRLYAAYSSMPQRYMVDNAIKKSKKKFK